MGFYFRKSKSFGPFRLNLSKSGLGLSTGIKGARLSFGPRGTYVNMGSGGLYYRRSSKEKSAPPKEVISTIKLKKHNIMNKHRKSISGKNCYLKALREQPYLTI